LHAACATAEVELSLSRIVVIGASAGGVRALQELVAELPGDFPAPILVVLHTAPDHKSLLPEILTSAGSLVATQAAHGEPVQNGHIYVSAPDHHLMITAARAVALWRGPKENHSRPSVDVLFRSAAAGCGSKTIGVVLSGCLADGSSGLIAIKSVGGVAVIQDPEEALYASMPLSAAECVDADHILDAREIGLLLGQLAAQPAPAEPLDFARVREDLRAELSVGFAAPFWRTDRHG
jgi:two-component system chemotaxis response regulator CheB